MNVNELTRRPYHVVLVRDETEDMSPGWVAAVAELPGCLSQGDTLSEAAENIQEAMCLWFESQMANGGDIPDPIEIEYPRIGRKGESFERPRFVEPQHISLDEQSRELAHR